MQDLKIQATLYLGANIKGENYHVSREQFTLWLKEHVTPVFTGFTVRLGEGFWDGESELSRELVLINTAMPDCKFKNAVSLIAASYRSRFKQEAVLVTFQPVAVEFVTAPHTVKPVMGERAIEPSNPNGNWD